MKMTSVYRPSRVMLALLSSSILGLGATAAQAQDTCTPNFTILPDGCEPVNAGAVVSTTGGANTQPVPLSQMPVTGLSLARNGTVILGDRAVRDIVRSMDVALADASVEVLFDGLEIRPRLDLEVLQSVASRGAGQQITLQSAINYPAFVTRGEVLIQRRSRSGAPEILGRLSIPANGRASFVMPQGDDITLVYRVYDAQGRYDETQPIDMGITDRRDRSANIEEGIDSARIRRIPVSGGAITVRGTDVVQGANVTALGERIGVDGQGRFILQRIVPAGTVNVNVAVNGTGQKVNLTRQIIIPRTETFGTGTLDLTVGTQKDGATGVESRYDTGRLAFYLNTKTAGGWNLTSSIDSGEGPTKEIFQRLEERDPRSLLLRVDPDDLFPTYGDDSTSEDLTPTSGRLFLNLEKDGNFFRWGDFKNRLGNTDLARNERTLYGAQAYGVSQSQTALGEPRAQMTLYAAQPNLVPQRDVFLATGGSFYFLEQQDVASGTETITIQYVDPDTGRVIRSVPLTVADYQINYVQGLVTLNTPLSNNSSDAVFGAQDAEVRLVAQYEYANTTGNLDGYAYGGRAEAWISDQLRVGLTSAVDETGSNDYEIIAGDITVRATERTYATLEYARSTGRVADSTFSADGGLIVENVAAGGTSGEAYKVEARADLRDVGLNYDATIRGYMENRTVGFSSLDAQVDVTTGDELFWGIAGDWQASETLTFGLAFDSYTNAVGDIDRTAAAKVSYDLSSTISTELGVIFEEKNNATEDGTRADIAARVTYTPDDVRSVYVFGQTSVVAEGLDVDDRIGAGGSVKVSDNWTAEGEVSSGTLGRGGRAMLSYDDDNGATRYAGYEIDPDRTLGGINLVGRDEGRIVVGGSQDLSASLAIFGENSYDLFGQHLALSSAFGLNFDPTRNLSYTAAVEFGAVDDGGFYDFERKAISLGARFDDEDLTAAGRIEVRQEDGIRAGQALDSLTVLASGNLSYKIDETQRVLASAKYARTDFANAASVPTSDYADFSLGYAYRPIDNDRLNILAQYRYLYDQFGYRRAAGAVDDDGPRQRSHVVNLAVSYDMDRSWTLGGKIGARAAETAAAGSSDFVGNNAVLLVANARYNVVQDWDVLLEVRHLKLQSSAISRNGALATVYKSMGNNVKVGVGYNFGDFSDDLTDLTYDDSGLFLNLIAKF